MGTAATHHSLLLKKSTPWGPFLLASVIGHVGLLFSGVVYSWLTAPPPMDLNQKPIIAKLVRKGTPRDEKLLPRKEELPPPPQEVKGQSAPVPVPVPTPAVAAPGPSAAAAAKAQKQAGAATGADRRKQLFGAFDKTSKKTNLDDLEGAVDGDPDGDAANAEGERYWGMLSAQVRRNYDVSQTIPEQERLHLKAKVTLFLSKTGGVLKQSIVSSGNPLFDNAVLAALKKAAPFSPPPEHLRDSLQKVGVTLEFKP